MESLAPGIGLLWTERDPTRSSRRIGEWWIELVARAPSMAWTGRRVPGTCVACGNLMRLMVPSEALEITVAESAPCWAGELGSAWLEWLVATRVPLVESEDSEVQGIIDASWRLRTIEFAYLGGSEPGTRRRVTPTFVFTVPGFHGVYVTGLCHKRKAFRTFRVDRMEALDGGAGE